MTGVDPKGGRDKALCLAKKRRKRGDGGKHGNNPVHDDAGNELCTRPAGWGTNHPGTGRCKLHGGATPDHRAASQRAQAEKAVETFGLPRRVDPREALLEEVWRTAGAVDWLGEQVRRLDPGAVIWGKTSEVDKQAGEFPGMDVTHAAAVNVWVDLWQRERKHMLAVTKAALDAGTEERRVRLAERQGALMASVFRGSLDDAAIQADVRQRIEAAFVRRMSLVAEKQTIEGVSA